MNRFIDVVIGGMIVAALVAATIGRWIPMACALLSILLLFFAREDEGKENK